MQNEPEQEKIVASVMSHLRARFPDAPPETVESEVRDVFSAYEDSKVRDFLGTLVERETTSRLRARGWSRQLA